MTASTAPTPPSFPSTAVGVSLLESWALIEVRGADALTFIQGQITQDIAGQATGRASPGGYCTAKGRLLATFVIWRANETTSSDESTVYALVRHDIADALVKRLSMFVLRAKARVTRRADVRLEGVIVHQDAALAELEQAAGGALARAAWSVTNLPTGTWIAAPTQADLHAPTQRWWRVAPADTVALSGIASAGTLDESAWHEADLRAGLAWIGALTQDLFIPQTVNLDQAGGVSFTKGCYPGQEVVARSHYRGTIKRRMFLCHPTQVPAAARAEPGMDLYRADRPDEPCSRVIDASGREDGYFLAEVPLDALEATTLHLGQPEGIPVTAQALDYGTQAA